MMSYEIDRLDGERIIIVRHTSDTDLASEAGAVVRDQLAILNAASQPVVFVVDMRGIRVDIDGVIRAADEVRTPGGQAVSKHPLRIATAVVTDNRLIRLAAKALNSARFGYLIAPLFGTLEEALAFARQQLDAGGPAT